MSDNSKIEWCTASWNPVTGCTKISAGCDHCYAETFAERWRGTPGHHFEQGFDVKLWPERLGIPQRWQKPRRIFVNSMSDLFHEDVPDEFIDSVFAAMADCPQHVFQLLTKRHGRMRSYLTRTWPDPLPNVWLGVSVEDQKWADIRIPALLETPAAVRFISAEPLLGPVDLHWAAGVDAIERDWTGGPGGGTGAPHPLLDWVIVGGESGAGARPMDLTWADRIVGDCRAAGVAVFVKQLGSVAGRVLDAGSKGGDWDAWPADLRVREFPAERVGAA